jgi:hypothetical protein
MNIVVETLHVGWSMGFPQEDVVNGASVRSVRFWTWTSFFSASLTASKAASAAMCASSNPSCSSLYVCATRECLPELTAPQVSATGVGARVRANRRRTGCGCAAADCQSAGYGWKGKCGGSVGVPVQTWQSPCQLVCWLLRKMFGLGEEDRCLKPRKSDVRCCWRD